MNIHVSTISDVPSRDEAAQAFARLKAWAESASPEEIAALDPALARMLGGGYPQFLRVYPDDFKVDAAYKASLPDLQNGPSSLIKGANRQIQHVGISNFRLPIPYHTRDNGYLTL